jgi:hypothetical protein
MVRGPAYLHRDNETRDEQEKAKIGDLRTVGEKRQCVCVFWKFILYT